MGEFLYTRTVYEGQPIHRGTRNAWGGVFFAGHRCRKLIAERFGRYAPAGHVMLTSAHLIAITSS